MNTYKDKIDTALIEKYLESSKDSIVSLKIIDAHGKEVAVYGEDSTEASQAPIIAAMILRTIKAINKQIEAGSVEKVYVSTTHGSVLIMPLSKGMSALVVLVPEANVGLVRLDLFDLSVAIERIVGE